MCIGREPDEDVRKHRLCTAWERRSMLGKETAFLYVYRARARRGCVQAQTLHGVRRGKARLEKRLPFFMCIGREPESTDLILYYYTFDATIKRA